MKLLVDRMEVTLKGADGEPNITRLFTTNPAEADDDNPNVIYQADLSTVTGDYGSHPDQHHSS